LQYYITGKTCPFSHFRLIHESIIQGGFFMRKLWFLLSISFILVLAACGFDDNNNNGNDGNNDANNSEDSAEEAKDNTINIFEDSEIPTLDSSHAHDLNGFSTLNNINEGLYRGDDANKPQPALAEEEEVNEDETEYIFTLRDDAEWSNGDPVTAHDFEYARKRTVDEVGHYEDMFATTHIENTEYVCTVRSDAEWNNGDHVTAHDFEYAWKRTFDEVGHYADMFAKANIENAQEILDEEKDPDDLGVEAEDDQTLKVTLEDPSP